jgi:Flp pilus assembly protein CpaB
MAVALAAIAAVAVYMFQTSGNEKQPTQAGAAVQPTATSIPTVAVLIANQDIAVNATITDGMVEVKQVPTSDKNARALSTAEEAIGKVTTVAIAQGEQVLNSRLTDGTGDAQGETFAYNVPAGKRAFSVIFDEVIGAGGLVQPGDHVDVIAYFKVKVTVPVSSLVAQSPSVDSSSDESSKEDNGDNSNNEQNGTKDVEEFVTSYVVQNVEVLAVAQALSPDDPGVASNGNADTPTPAPTSEADVASEPTAEPVARPKALSVTLAVTPEQVQRLLLAAQTVTEDATHRGLRLSLRAPGDTTIYDLRPAQTGQFQIVDALGDINQPMIPSELVITNAEFKRRVLSSGEVLEFKVTVKNISSNTTIKTDKSVPGEFTYTEGEAYDALGFYGKSGTYRIGLNVSDAYPTQYPYRWGLGHDLKPGESVDIVGSVKLTETTPDTRYWFGVIREPDVVSQDGVSVTDITVLPAAAAVVKDVTAQLRVKPSAKGQVTKELNQDDYLTVLETRGDWFHVQGPGGVEGWIESAAVQVVPPAPDEEPAAATPAST